MSKVINQHRINNDGLESDDGRIFVNPKTAKITDLSGVRLLRCAVDTVRQLYRGKIKTAIFDLFESPGMVWLGDYQWHAGRIGRDSGYQFRLQNADLGIILLIKNFNVKETDNGPHLKIEVSPHTIENHTPEHLQSLLDGLAGLVLDDFKQNQCAIHIALDVQGWTPPADTVARMQCRSKRVRDISGINSFDFAATASVYGNGETYMFGSAGGVQLAIYDKTKQAKATDKLDFGGRFGHGLTATSIHLCTILSKLFGVLNFVFIIQWFSSLLKAQSTWKLVNVLELAHLLSLPRI